jgi:hypothetical protein
MLEEPLQAVVEVLQTAFPSGPGADYAPLLAVLYDDLSEENLGLVMEAFAGVDRHIAVHDAIDAVTKKRPSPADVARVRAVLEENGWSDED